MIKKNDLLLMSAALLVVLICYLYNNIFNKAGDYVSVNYRGNEVAKHSLSDSGEYEIPCSANEAFRYKIENGEVFCIYSECRDKICIHQGKINRNGQSVICLPQQIVLTVHGKGTEYDALTD